VDFDFPEDPEVWHPVVNVARDLFDLGVRIAEAAENAPEIFNDNHWARYGAQVEYMDALFATIESCDLEETADSDKKGKSYSQIVKKCEDYTLNLDGRRPYLSELCDTANVSERTLQYAFHDIMGMSPLTYLHRLRLHRARDELRKANSKSTSVTDVALNWGFWHFGEFSRAYKNCFGEVPSKTLRQTTSE
jgi:AraC-like DNA-binding protein